MEKRRRIYVKTYFLKISYGTATKQILLYFKLCCFLLVGWFWHKLKSFYKSLLISNWLTLVNYLDLWYVFRCGSCHQAYFLSSESCWPKFYQHTSLAWFIHWLNIFTRWVYQQNPKDISSDLCKLSFHKLRPSMYTPTILDVMFNGTFLNVRENKQKLEGNFHVMIKFNPVLSIILFPNSVPPFHPAFSWQSKLFLLRKYISFLIFVILLESAS